MKSNIIIFTIICILSSIVVTKAQTYSNDTNLFESTYTNNLIDMANSQIKNFNSSKYLIFRSSDDYYLVSSVDVSVIGNQVTMANSTIISAIRTSEGYSSVYTYSTTQESSTTINLSNIVVSNIDTDYSVSSTRFEEYKHDQYLLNIGIFILGLIFALFLTKERKY